jgi:hypothetical protein
MNISNINSEKRCGVWINIDYFEGWKNRETLLVSLWLNNDEGMYALLCEAFRQETQLFDRADWLEKRMRERLEDKTSTPSLWSDMLSTSFAHVNWAEIIAKNKQ